ncbi:uncharacterized protein LACBIDRAFT_317361 [Laccaria bicolor S238N-H82]|uniref:Predicted protein n=1 Tax=Laccaria bicolor (strain S238N-H82 / ATCC MYA-4686) TaxID=486041 RepID=B0D502_LACBS|nr:uncharacterized protein LACBIDRAFT_317361 [Laccaria bicolor S238N-H82]EDR10652.1 predicted protein [Laccaria bicolor S238N-H82]|eukprot:XP_001879102.1 predicted protein [Laccaria bicolor S238N-H82]
MASESSLSGHAANLANQFTPPQIRSRITIVCAECKRLKLKCDRKTPCGSCAKRGTIVRCIYAPEAVEKIDLHSLHNRISSLNDRLVLVESTLAKMNAAPPAFQSPSQSSITAYTGTPSTDSVPLFADDVSMRLDPLISGYRSSLRPTPMCHLRPSRLQTSSNFKRRHPLLRLNRIPIPRRRCNWIGIHLKKMGHRCSQRKHL